MITRLENMSARSFVEKFATIALAQDRALLDGDTEKFNSLYDEMDAVSFALKNLAGDQRSALLQLYKHPNAQVRLKAAISTLAVAPGPAREVLEAIVAQREYPQSADARGMLRALDEGSFVPS
ncbi:MAG: DUF2019 domain-containing protein [Rhizobiales bacterium]|nr:DUF2019 domain-containing protein [Hyphomicrobiales bacterium]